MRESLKSLNWPKRLRMSQFVQAGKISLVNASCDPLPEQKGDTVFHILLRDGMFSKAKLLPSGFGRFIWAYPIHPVEYLQRGIFLPSEVVAWKEIVWWE